MSQESCSHDGVNTDPTRGDSAGVPWEGRSFQPNPNAGDDGSADPALLAELQSFRAGAGSQAAVVRAFRDARVLIPLLAERGDEGVGPTGLTVDKTQELSIFTVAAPDGRSAQPVFTSVETLAAWDREARPIPVAASRVALSAASEDSDLVVIDPGQATEFVVRRPALWAIAQDQEWIPSFESPEVATAFNESIGQELAVIDLALSAGDPTARLRGPELVVTLTLNAGLDRDELTAVTNRLAQRWSRDDRIAVLVDSLAVKLVSGD